MRFALGFLVPVVALIVTFWWWLGLPVAMPTSPLAAGEKLPCASYAPFRTETSFGEFTSPVRAATIEADLTTLSKMTSCVRTYSTGLGVDQVPEIARRHGMTVLLGIWLGRNLAENKREVEAAVALANAHPDVVKMVIVGNEVLLRGELSPEALSAYIRDVKSRVKVPVTFAEVWEFWLRFRQVAEAVDIVTVHMLPYWEDIPIPAADAARHVDVIHDEVAKGFPGKDIMIGEVGWPSAGRMREGALPSPASQARFMQDMMAAAKRGNYRLNVIEAFDQPWKRQSEGTVGGHWGLIAADGQSVKFNWGAPVSNHSWWRLQAAAGAAFAALIFALAYAAGRGNPGNRPAHWVGVAVIALAAGLTIGWTIENLPIESLGAVGWAVSLYLAGLAILCPPVAAIALARAVPRPAFAALLGSAPPPDGRLARVAGVLVMALCVIAVALALGLAFDPRYRDFPFAPLTAAVIPWLVLGIREPQSARGVAERLAAAVLLACTMFILWNEGVANWQSLWLCAAFLALSLTLSGVPGARRQGS